jgi:prolyl-tRNA editing enzyme YbaK/EbsC (Cys-tRNA(Pro) deacylase)
MDTTDLERFINESGIDAQIVNLESETPTVEAAAAAVGVSTDHIGKSLLFLVQGEPVLVIANGSKRISYKRLAEYLDTNRKRIKFATSAQVEDLTGYSIGSVPPFGHKQKLKTFIEEGVMDQDTGGDGRATGGYFGNPCLLLARPSTQICPMLLGPATGARPQRLR